MANLIASLYYAVKLHPYPRPFFSALTENSLRSSHHDNAQPLFSIRFERTANGCFLSFLLYSEARLANKQIQQSVRGFCLRSAIIVHATTIIAPENNPVFPHRRLS